MKTNKKGQMSQGTIIAIVLALVIFGILAMGLKTYSGILSSETPKEVCKASASARAIMFSKNAIARNALDFAGAVPDLSCKTEYVCLSEGSDCQKGYSKINVADANGIKKELADSMVSCWNMLGSGKIDFIGNTFSRDKACIICSQIKFDKNSREKVSKITDFTRYIATEKFGPSGLTYLKYLSNNINAKEVLGTQTTIDLSKEYAVMYVFTTKSYWQNLVGTSLGTVAGGGAATYAGIQAGAVVGTFVGPVGTAAWIVVGGAAGAIVGGTAGYLSADKSADTLGREGPIQSVFLIEYNPNEIAKNCDAIMSTA